jgi:hypothetical protein
MARWGTPTLFKSNSIPTSIVPFNSFVWLRPVTSPMRLRMLMGSGNASIPRTEGRDFVTLSGCLEG